MAQWTLYPNAAGDLNELSVSNADPFIYLGKTEGLVDLASSLPSGSTYLRASVVSALAGIIDTVNIQPETNITGLRVGTFYLVSGTTYKCRASVSLGNANAGFQQFTGLSLAVQVGDLIGCYFATGTIEAATSGGVGVYSVSGEYIDADDQAAYSLDSGGNDDLDLAAYRDNAGHWEAVLTNDGNTSYVYASIVQQTTKQDLLNLDNPSLSGTITDVSVKAIIGKTQSTASWAELILKTGGTVYSGGNFNPAQAYTLYTASWANNPQTGIAWTWADITALQSGVGLKNLNPTPTCDPRCTQVYVEVTYTPTTTFIPKVFIV